MKILNDYQQAWEDSYQRGENNILYPQAEVIRFINRFISKQNSDRSVTPILETKERRSIRGLDFACGVGTHGISFHDFGIEPYGADISKIAIKHAKNNAAEKDFTDNFIVINSADQTLPYEDNFFDFVVAESCLDSMPFETAKKYLSELKRFCNGVIYSSFIGKDDNMHEDEFVVTTAHEKGTFQTTFDDIKISELFGVEQEKFKYFQVVSQTDVKTNRLVSKRYYCVIDSKLVGQK